MEESLLSENKQLITATCKPLPQFQ